MMTDEEAKEYFSDPLRRLENNHYALEKARDRLEVAIESRDNNEIYTATGELLLWVLTTDEWHKKHYKNAYEERRDNNEKGQLLLGLIHAYNSMKHNMNFIEIHQRKGGVNFASFSFPLAFPPITVHWTTIGQLNEGGKRRIKDYIDFIEGKEIISTFDTAIEFLYEEYERIK